MYTREKQKGIKAYQYKKINKIQRQIVRAGKTDKQKLTENKKMATVNPSLQIISLNISGLNSPIKNIRVAEWI